MSFCAPGLTSTLVGVSGWTPHLGAVVVFAAVAVVARRRALTRWRRNR